MTSFCTVIASRSSKNCPDNFCYVCGEFTLIKNRKQISSHVEAAYYTYSGVKVCDHDSIGHLTSFAQCELSSSLEKRKERFGEFSDPHGLAGAIETCTGR